MTSMPYPKKIEHCATEILGDERVVYDLQTHYVHRLSGFTRTLWEACDGTLSVEALRAYAHTMDASFQHIAVQTCLGELTRAGLITGYQADARAPSQEKRKTLATLAVAGAAMSAMLVPRAAEAVSCGGLSGNATGVSCDTSYAAQQECCGEDDIAQKHICGTENTCEPYNHTIGTGHWCPTDSENCETNSVCTNNVCCIPVGLAPPDAPIQCCSQEVDSNNKCT
jgi:hypothetical protein